MDCDMSITSMMTARLRGMRMSWVGVASAIVKNTRHSSDMAIGRCRHGDCATGASVYRCRRWRRRAAT
ncbi:hypothetical protein A5625_06280 [Mycobacterium sp. 1465703.0]|nr:hypothetical protein A5625_06280 [Mycobacterium sp. 1465703.0]